MNITPFTIEEAKDLCAAYQSVATTEFIAGNKTVLIEEVHLSSLSVTNQGMFLTAYGALKEAALSLGKLTGSEYNIIAIGVEKPGKSALPLSMMIAEEQSGYSLKVI